MKVVKWLFCIVIALLFLCASLIGCSAPQEETPNADPQEQVSTDDPQLTAIIEKWDKYVVDRTVKITQAQLTYGMADSHLGLRTEETVITEILDICETLDVTSLKLTEDNKVPEIPPYGGGLHVVLTSVDVTSSVGEPNIDSIYLYVKDNGEVYLHCDIDGTVYWACASGWFAYDRLGEYKYSK